MALIPFPLYERLVSLLDEDEVNLLYELNPQDDAIAMENDENDDVNALYEDRAEPMEHFGSGGLRQDGRRQGPIGAKNGGRMPHPAGLPEPRNDLGRQGPRIDVRGQPSVPRNDRELPPELKKDDKRSVLMRQQPTNKSDASRLVNREVQTVNVGTERQEARIMDKYGRHGPTLVLRPSKETQTPMVKMVDKSTNEPEQEQKPRLDQESEQEIEPGSEQELEPEFEPELEQETEQALDSEPEPDRQPEPDPQPEPARQPKPDRQPEPDRKPEPDRRPELDRQPESDHQPESDDQSDQQSDWEPPRPNKPTKRQPRYPCHICSSHFSTGAAFRNHLYRVHQEDEPPDVDFEPVKTKLKDDAGRKMEQLMACYYCKSTFKTRRGFVRHSINIHGLEPQDEDAMDVDMDRVNKRKRQEEGKATKKLRKPGRKRQAQKDEKAVPKKRGRPRKYQLWEPK